MAALPSRHRALVLVLVRQSRQFLQVFLEDTEDHPAPASCIRLVVGVLSDSVNMKLCPFCIYTHSYWTSEHVHTTSIKNLGYGMKLSSFEMDEGHVIRRV